MTKEQAERLAKHDETYRARKLRGQWVVWCDASIHCEPAQSRLQVLM